MSLLATRHDQEFLPPCALCALCVRTHRAQTTFFADEPCTTNLDLGDNLLLVKLLSPHAEIPTQGSKSAAGYDLYSSEGLILPPKTRKLVDTGIAVAMNTPKTCMPESLPGQDYQSKA